MGQHHVRWRRHELHASNSTASNALAVNAIINVHCCGKWSEGRFGTPLLVVPLDVVPLLMLATPVLLLFVYDKNNGVLEYLLSLGMTQRDIYMRYLKAALLLASIFFVIFVPATFAYGYAVYGAGAVATILPIPLIAVPFSLVVVSFMVMAMMAFSSLQKTRAGSNQPLGLIIGWLATTPGYGAFHIHVQDRDIRGPRDLSGNGPCRVRLHQVIWKTDKEGEILTVGYRTNIIIRSRCS